MRAAQDIILKADHHGGLHDAGRGQKYTFKVAIDANKIEIAKAVEELFKVSVAKVNTMNCKGREKESAETSGYKPNWKKSNCYTERGFKRVLSSSKA